MCMYMPLRPQKTSGVILTLYDWLKIIVAAFQLQLMDLAVNVTIMGVALVTNCVARYSLRGLQ